MLEGNVAEIISDEMFVLNIGIEAGVREGMVFIIYKEGPHVYDRSTGKDLGPLEIVKGRVRVDHAMPKMSQASTLKEVVEVADLSWWWRGIGTRKEARPIKLEVAQVSETLAQAVKDRVIMPGDKVRYVSGPKE